MISHLPIGFSSSDEANAGVFLLNFHIPSFSVLHVVSSHSSASGLMERQLLVLNNSHLNPRKIRFGMRIIFFLRHLRTLFLLLVIVFWEKLFYILMSLTSLYYLQI